MKANSYPNHIQSKLDQLSQQVEHFTEQAARTKDAIAGARQRLSGGFQTDQEFTDLRTSLDQLVTDQPVLDRKLRDAQFVLADCKAWLDQLPSDAVLEPVPPAKHDDDLSLDDARQRIDDMQDELQRLRLVPVPGADVEKRIKAYVAGLARPKIGGVAAGQELRVDWPSKDPIALLAFLHPNEMVNALTQEVVRQQNVMPLPERKRRLEDLELEIEVLQRRALGLGIDLCLLPPEVIFGVEVTRPSKRVSA